MRLQNTADLYFIPHIVKEGEIQYMTNKILKDTNIQI